MSSHRAFPFRAVAAAFAVVAAAQAEGQLAKSSPFMPPQGAASTAPTAGAPLEFRGWIQTADGVLFRLRDPARKADTWVKLNEHDSTLDVTPKQHDTDRNTLTIEHQGRTLTLAVRESKIVSAGSAAQPVPLPAPAQAPNVSAAVTQSVVVNPSPADEQRRLEAVAAEVARRRALREQAAQQTAPGAPGAQPPPQFTPARPMTPAQAPRMPAVQGSRTGSPPQQR